MKGDITTMSIKKLLFTAIASLSLAQIAVAQTDQPKPPNIIVILGDDIGFNDIEPFGQTVIQTPELTTLSVAKSCSTIRFIVWANGS